MLPAFAMRRTRWDDFLYIAGLAEPDEYRPAKTQTRHSGEMASRFHSGGNHAAGICPVAGQESGMGRSG